MDKYLNNRCNTLMNILLGCFLDDKNEKERDSHITVFVFTMIDHFQ